MCRLSTILPILLRLMIRHFRRHPLLLKKSYHLRLMVSIRFRYIHRRHRQLLLL